MKPVLFLRAKQLISGFVCIETSIKLNYLYAHYKSWNICLEIFIVFLLEHDFNKYNTFKDLKTVESWVE